MDRTYHQADRTALIWRGHASRDGNLGQRVRIPLLRTLQAATYDNARILKIDDRTGSIQLGLEGDLLIGDGNPAQNISDTRNIKHVFANGKLSTVNHRPDSGVTRTPSAAGSIGRVVAKVVPTQSALVSNNQRRAVEISAHQRW